MDSSQLTITVLTVLQSVLLLALLGLLYWRGSRPIGRRSREALEKKISEILWRVRESVPTEFRKQVVKHEERMDQSLQTLREVAQVVESQIAKLRSAAKEVPGQAPAGVTSELPELRQSSSALHVLERISRQLQSLDRIDTKMTQLTVTHPKQMFPEAEEIPAAPPEPGGDGARQAVQELLQLGDEIQDHLRRAPSSTSP